MKRGGGPIKLKLSANAGTTTCDTLLVPSLPSALPSLYLRIGDFPLISTLAFLYSFDFESGKWTVEAIGIHLTSRPPTTPSHPHSP